MLRWIIGSSLKLRVLVVGIAAAVAVLGVTQLRHAPADVLPEFSPPYVEIQTEALGLSPNEVEELITAPMEADLLNGVEGVDVIRSKSVPGMSSIVLVFQRGTDIFRARQLVQERLNQAHALPQVSKPPQMLQPLSSSSRVLVIGLSAKKLSLIQQSVLARWTIRPRLMGVPGVANVEIWGQRERQLQVQVDPQRLRAQGVSLRQIIDTAGNAQFVSPLTFLEGSTPGTGGFFDTPSQRLGIRHVFPTANPRYLAKVSVEGTGARRLRLSDVATVREDHQPLIGDSVKRDGAGLLLVVEKLPGANTLKVTRGVEDALDELRPGLAGMRSDTSVYRPAGFIEEAMHNLTLALIIGAVLLALAVAALLFDWRTVLISLIAVPLSVIAAALVLDLSGATFNALIVAGLVVALGVIVDDAIAGVGNYMRRLPEPSKQDGFKATMSSLLEATLEVRRPLVYATLIVLFAALPMFFLDGVSGHMFGSLAGAYVLAVLASTLVALTVTPALCLLLLAKTPVTQRQMPGMGALRHRYEGALARVTPRVAFAAAAVMGLAALAALPAVRNSSLPSLLPSFKERTLLINWDARAGTARQEMDRIVTRASGELRSVPGVHDVGAHVGRAVTGDQVGDVNNAQIWVNIDRSADYDKTVRSVQGVISGYPGLHHELLTYSKQRVRQLGAMEDGRDDNHNGREDTVLTTADENGTGARRDIIVRVYGYDLGVLQRKAGDVKHLLSQVDGVAGPTVERQAQQPTVQVEVNLSKARRYGLKPGDVRRAASALVSGIVVGSLFEQQKVFDVVVWGTPATRRSLSSIRQLLIETQGGGHVELGKVADVRIAPAPGVIRRDAVQRRIDVSADVRGRSLGAVERDVQRRLDRLAFPLEYHAELLAPAGERRAAERRIISIAIAAAIGILLLLQAAFRSWRLAALVFLTLPLALGGGLIAVWIAGRTISIGSVAGFLAVLGIAARNGVLLGSRYQDLGQYEPIAPGLVLRGAGERLAPTLTTAVATGLVVLPFVLLGDIAGLELLQPMAVVVLGGLVTSTLVALFVAPALYPLVRARPIEADVPSTSLNIGGAPAPAGQIGGRG
jgi:CzcA family heavy metal efflux pump